eukprot:12906173-Prorocentrum_lima.AAC.1
MSLCDRLPQVEQSPKQDLAVNHPVRGANMNAQQWLSLGDSPFDNLAASSGQNAQQNLSLDSSPFDLSLIHISEPTRLDVI